ncbi:MAG: hypothetical protein HY664_00790 [Chloroflexi bacterium]|nr:hypothetical protein [Chloroflexota bacterium]
MSTVRKPVLLVVAPIAALMLGAALFGSRGEEREPWKSVVPQPDIAVKGRPSYVQDIKPIFDQSCIRCHGPVDAHNGLRLDSYEGVMAGTLNGPIVYPGEPSLSNLLTLIKHESSPQIWMPYHQEELSPNRIRNIENWVKDGARDN